MRAPPLTMAALNPTPNPPPTLKTPPIRNPFCMLCGKDLKNTEVAFGLKTHPECDRKMDREREQDEIEEQQQRDRIALDWAYQQATKGEK